MSETIKDDLQALFDHPGWRLFLDHAKDEWGPRGYGRKIKQVVQQAKTHKTDAGAAVERVDYANDAIDSLLSWPAYEVERLTRAEAEVKETHPRPALDPALAGQSRRGGL